MKPSKPTVALAISGPGAVVTANSLTILSEEGFHRVGAALVQMDKIGPWLWGDMLLYAEKHNLRSVLETTFDLPHRNRIRDYVETARLFAPKDRNPALSFSHHDAVNYQLSDSRGSIPDVKEAKAWLARAEEHEWTVGDLREAMRLEKRKDERDPGPMRGDLHFADFIKISRWSATVRVSDLPDEQAVDLRKTTEPLFTFLCELHRKPFSAAV